MMVACVNYAPSFALIVLISMCFQTRLAIDFGGNIETLSYEHFKTFIDESNVRLVFFKQQVETPNVNSFLREYALAADDLETYGIKLGLVMCESITAKIKYCSEDGPNDQFVYGFRNSNEKIALPLETLYDSNSIVSSALHLTLIQSVPIIQQLNERQQLESHCKGKCSIIFTFQRILGTHEHRIFIEAAYLNLNNFLFALTTSEVATIGLRRLQNEGDSNGILEEPAVWVLHCARIERNSMDDCPQSNYRHPIELKPFLQFLQTINLPDWVIIPKGSNNVSFDDYGKFKLHSVYFLYDDSTKENVEMLAPNIGVWFKGTLGVIGININEISRNVLMKSGFGLENIKLPAIGFKSYNQEKIIIMNEYDNAYNFILDQIRYSSVNHQEIGVAQQTSETLAQLDELQQDDEVAKYLSKYQSENSDVINSDVEQLTDETYPEVMKKNKFNVILYYLHWDTVSQIALRIFSRLLKTQSELKSILYRVDCFEWTDACTIANITSYPTIRIHTAQIVKLYQGPLKVRSLLQVVYLYQKPNPTLLNNTHQIASFISTDIKEYPQVKLPSVVLIGINSNNKVNGTIYGVSKTLHGKISLGLCFDPVCNEIIKNYSLTLPFAITFKPMDPFLKYEIMDSPFTFENLYKFAMSSSMETFPKLTATNFVKMQETKKPLAILFRNVNNLTQDVYQTLGKFLSTHKRNYNFNFAWLDASEPLGKNVYSSYVANSGIQVPFSVVVIDHNKECFYIYPKTDLEDANFFSDWLKNIEEESQEPTGYLPKGDWKPRLPGFDYLKFIDEDHVRDAEDKSNPELTPDPVNDLQQSRLYRYPGSSDKKNKMKPSEKPVKIQSHGEL